MISYVIMTTLDRSVASRVVFILSIFVLFIKDLLLKSLPIGTYLNSFNDIFIYYTAIKSNNTTQSLPGNTKDSII